MDATGKKRKVDSEDSKQVSKRHRQELLSRYFIQAASTSSTTTPTPTSATPISATAGAQPPVPSLSELLDFSSLDTQSDISTRFGAIARALLHDFRLVVTSGDNDSEHTVTEFQILELEFYLQKSECHVDPFTHGSEEQKISGRWYFHRAPRYSKNSHFSSTSLTEYRDGSRKGLDLTIGQVSPVLASSSGIVPESSLLRGGILLRSLRRLGANPKVISGPSLLVDEILLRSGATSIPDLVENKWQGDTSAFPPASSDAASRPVSLYLKTVPSDVSVDIMKKSPAIYCSPRIGLDLSHPGTTAPPKDHASSAPLHPRILFLPKPYRYFTHPTELTTKGRPQTFLGVLYICLTGYPDPVAALTNSRVPKEVSRLTGMKEANVVKYLGDYQAGRAGGAGMLERFVGARGKGAASSPASYLQMMGALEQVCGPQHGMGLI